MKKFFRFLLVVLPPKLSIQLRYYYNLHKFINFKNPLTFGEKLQWLKLYNKKTEYTMMVDKYLVKEYVKNIIGSKYIIPTLGIWDTPNSIDWDLLPQKFVLKTTHAGGSAGVVICRNKDTFDKSKAVKQLNHSYKTDSYAVSKEWPYKNVQRRVIAEQLLETDSNCGDLADYKWFCFNGVPKFCQVIKDRSTNETIDFFDTEWNHQEFIGLNPRVKNAKELPQKPEKLELQISIACQLSKNIPFVRIDLYEVKGKVFFGEITFFPFSGMGQFLPNKYNKILGDMIDLTKCDSYRY